MTDRNFQLMALGLACAVLEASLGSAMRPAVDTHGSPKRAKRSRLALHKSHPRTAPKAPLKGWRIPGGSVAFAEYERTALRSPVSSGTSLAKVVEGGYLPTYLPHSNQVTPNLSGSDKATQMVASLSAGRFASLPESKLCTLNLKNAKLADAISLLCKQTGLDLVLLTGPETTVTINITDMPLVDVLRHLCAMTNLAFIKSGSAFIVGTSEQLQKSYPKEFAEASPAPKPAPEPVKPEEQKLVTRAVRTNHLSAGQIVESLKTFFGDRGLVVVAAPPTVSPSLELSNAGQQTGATGQLLTNQQTGADNGSRVIMLRGPEEVVKEAEELIRQVDLAQKQVSIAVTVHDISNEALKEVGISWSFGNITVSEANPTSGPIGDLSRTGGSLTGIIKSLESSDKAKLLASPNIAVLSGSRSSILIGDRITLPILVSFTNGQPIFSTQQERVGIYLQVAAEVGQDGTITLTLAPQVSAISRFIEVNGASYPQIATREAQSTLRIKSGDSVILGGLIREEELRQWERVPLLSDVPFFGELFRRRKTSKRSSQLIITVTPTILDK